MVTNQMSGAPIKAVIFDLDGTLLNTLKSLADCFNRVLVASSFPAHPEAAFRYFIGDGARKCVERCLPVEHRNDSNIDRVLKLQQLDYGHHWQEDVSLYSGISELLVELRTMQIPMAVLSNKDHSFVQQCIEHFFPPGMFEVVQGFSSEIPHKPEPYGALSIVQRLHLSPAEVVLVGDTAVDISTAKAAGMPSVGVLWGFRDLRELNNAGADHVIDAPDQILDLIPLFRGRE